MSTSIDEAKLKDLLKSAIAEVLEERREFVKEIIEEAMEDVALARAIDEGVGTDAVSRQEVFTILESPQNVLSPTNGLRDYERRLYL